MTKEDKLIPKLIELAEPPDQEKDQIELQAEPESHYNYYGNRGVVDLTTRLTGQSDFYALPNVNVYEIKSTHAVENATGANEILRQFNRHRKYYFKDESNNRGAWNTFELVFIPTKTTVKHVLENYEVYLAAKKSMPDGYENNGNITFRSPTADDLNPAQAVIDSDYAPGIDEPSEYIEHAEKINSGSADHVARILKQINLANE